MEILVLFGAFGIAYGIVIERSGFCFSRATFELFLLKSRDALNGILVGMAVAATGFSIVSAIRAAAGLDVVSHLLVLPVGPGTVIGGLLFGAGMNLAGMCATGTLQRLGEGYAVAVVVLLGAVIGAALDPLRGLRVQAWRQYSPEVWLGESVGIIPACLITVALLMALWWLLSGRSAMRRAEGSLRQVVRETFSEPTTVGGALLGVLSTAQMAAATPWTVAYPLGIVSAAWTGTLGQSSLERSWPFIVLDLGLIAGVAATAAVMGDLRLRWPRQARSLIAPLAGGVLMGWGVQTAGGCSIGGAFSAIASLSLSGWAFFVALCLGSWLGLQIVRRIS